MSDAQGSRCNGGRCASLEELLERRDAIVIAWRTARLDARLADVALAELDAVDDLGARWSWQLDGDWFELVREDPAGPVMVMERQRLTDAAVAAPPTPHRHSWWVRTLTVVFVVAAVAAAASFWWSLRGL